MTYSSYINLEEGQGEEPPSHSGPTLVRGPGRCGEGGCQVPGGERVSAVGVGRKPRAAFGQHASLRVASALTKLRKKPSPVPTA